MLGPELQRGQSARDMLSERRRLDRALDSLQRQRPGTIDAYVVAVALDSDPVFGREAREAGQVLSRRYGAAGRSITLAGPDGRGAGLPRGSLSSLTIALARIATDGPSRRRAGALFHQPRRAGGPDLSRR
jgi:hypothetical protein